MIGSLQKQKGSKNWYMVFPYSDKNGQLKQKWISTGTASRAKAQRILFEKQMELETGFITDHKNMTVSALLDEYQNQIINKTLAYSTARRYNGIIRNDLKPNLGHYKINKVNPLLIQKHINMLEESGKSPYTIKQHHTVIFKAFDYAVKWQLLNKNPCTNIQLPKKTQRKPTVWTIEECKVFYNFIQDKDYHIPLLLAITTGARRGEISALKLSDYDSETGFLHIHDNMQENGELRGTTKTNKARYFKLANTTQEALNKHILNIKEIRLFDKNYNKEDWLCIKPNGNVYKPKDLYGVFKKATRECGLPEIRFHDLRHGFATLMLETGEIDIKTVSEMLGHAKITTTQQIYQHVTPKMKQDLADSIENTFFK